MARCRAGLVFELASWWDRTARSPTAGLVRYVVAALQVIGASEPSLRWLDVPFAAAGHSSHSNIRRVLRELLVVRVRAEGLRACEMVGLYCAEAQPQAPRGSYRLPSDCTLVHKP